MTKRTQKESATVVAKVVGDIRKVLDAAPIMTGYDWFDNKEFRKNGLDELITNSCIENDINEEHIRTVAGLNN